MNVTFNEFWTKNLHNKYGYKVFLVHPQNKIWNSLAAFVAERYGMLGPTERDPTKNVYSIKSCYKFSSYEHITEGGGGGGGVLRFKKKSLNSSAIDLSFLKIA